jgi:F-type H+-transporting ATPase subunit b
MRHNLVGWRLHGTLLALLLVAPGCSRTDEHHKAAGPPTILATDTHHKAKKFNLADAKQKEEFFKEVEAGHLEHMEVEKPVPNPIVPVWDLGLWSLVVFLVILFILNKYAWGPIMEGLHKREETIRSAVEEAKLARAETERISREFKAKMDQAYAEIPKIMENARRDAEAHREEMRVQTTKEIQTERQRLRREIETARDQALQELWNQAAQLATLISAKAIGRSLTEDDHRRLLDEGIAELAKAGQARQVRQQ